LASVRQPSRSSGLTTLWKRPSAAHAASPVCAPSSRRPCSASLRLWDSSPIPPCVRSFVVQCASPRMGGGRSRRRDLALTKRRGAVEPGKPVRHEHATRADANRSVSPYATICRSTSVPTAWRHGFSVQNTGRRTNQRTIVEGMKCTNAAGPYWRAPPASADSLQAPVNGEDIRPRAVGGNLRIPVCCRARTRTADAADFARSFFSPALPAAVHGT